MKKLIVLFSVLAFFSLILIGCQSSENITAPGDLQKPGPVVWGLPTPGDDAYTVDLVQAQFDDVGSVTIDRVGNTLVVTYSIDEERDCEITEIHVDLATHPSAFNANSQGNPTFGNFDTKNYGVVANLGTSEVTVTFSEADLKAALQTENLSGVIYVAAHAVVCCDEGEATEEVCPELPASSILTSWVDAGINDLYTFLLTFNPAPTSEGNPYNGWCVDLTNSLTGAAGTEFNFVCSYGDVPECIVDYPGNLAKANWIINNREGYLWYEVQRALWELLDPYEAGDAINPDNYDIYTAGGAINNRFQELLDAADAYETANGPFTPGCGEKVLVLAYDGEPCDGNFQRIAFEAPVECEQTCETAMAFPYPTDGYSSLFPGAKWFRYIAFNL
jgi:hypothetical protein